MVAIITILWPNRTYANYVDPTTGGILLQIIFGGVAGIAVLLKLFWHRFVSFFARIGIVRRRRRPPLGDSEAQDSLNSKDYET